MGSLLVVVGLFSMIAMANAKSEGAPKSACLSMVPLGHYGISAQTSASPFTVSVSKSTYSPSETLTITLASSTNTQFKGFLLEASMLNANSIVDQNVGIFTAGTGSKIVTECGGITHTEASQKSSRAIQWTAPSEGKGNLVFLVTFVQNYTTFWVKVRSAEITFRPPSQPTTTSRGPTSSPVKTPSRPTMRQTTRTTPRFTTEAAPPQRIPLEISCGTNKSCFANCELSSCLTHVTWDVLEDSKEILFHMRSIFSGNSNKWMAIGFSEDYKMGSDSVVECVASSEDGFAAFSSYNSDYKLNTREASSSNAVTLVGASLEGNEFSCSVRRKLNALGNFVEFDLTQKSRWYLLFAQGETSSSGEKKRHKLQGWNAPFTSTVSLDLDNPQLLGKIKLTSGGTNTVGSFAVLFSSLLTLVIR